MERTAHTATASPDAWTLSDGHAGNVRQATALAVALGYTAAQDWSLRPRAPWRWTAPRKLWGCTYAFGRDFAAALHAPPALAIGCGRQAALATRLLRERGSRAVQILDPRLDPKHWDLIIAPEHDDLRGDNVITLLGSLHPVDDAWLAQAREDFSVLSPLPQPRTALLLGGPSKHVDLDATTFAKQLARLEAALLREGGSLMLTTSRRTPVAWREQVRQRFATVPGVRWFGANGNTTDDDNPYPGMLAWADRIVCTPDSVNMLSEACATHAPVYVLDPTRTRGRLRSFNDSLLALGRTRALDDTLASFAVEPLRETARVAAEVRARLGL
ncbi:mitochondrial fission ELM1 family protein [Lysobacter sp. CFH 32150]|uniref:mitochondrial fission ELM1 family protein n=1 Tax=Lysobacter sp. CFH 32150 TaxID=2927128 RepID=UPI001FA758E7|nr:mitochondrial fission ELM1 family protein [Lysobacter sp. CFH 32150]MCI4568308.1 mitochondrial fission ELM1 family protein [Lysobacter sp. CFH 32150]